MSLAIDRRAVAAGKPATTFDPIRHPGERRDPWLRRTRRSRAVITRSATMGPGVRRDDGKGRRHKIAPAPATTHPPVIPAKAGTQSHRRTRPRPGSRVEPGMTAGGGRIASLGIDRLATASAKPATTRPSNGAHSTVTPRPLPVILAKARIQSCKRNPPRLWVLGRAQDDGRGRAYRVSLAIDRMAGGWRPRKGPRTPPSRPPPPVIPAKAGTQSPKRTRPRP
ncbi:hypothetical protein J3A66_001435 [Sphingomonas sp. PvP018]|nr:hypothetical protein [Sphingomonas sp. PvP018]